MVRSSPVLPVSVSCPQGALFLQGSEYLMFPPSSPLSTGSQEKSQGLIDFPGIFIPSPSNIKPKHLNFENSSFIEKHVHVYMCVVRKSLTFELGHLLDLKVGPTVALALPR